MKFKFGLETLMRARKTTRDEAERDYRLALSKVEDQKQKLQGLRKKLSEAIEEVQIIREGGGKLTAALISTEEFLVGQKIRIQGQIKLVKGLEEIADQKRQILVEATKEHKILEKLREKRYNEFKIKLRKQETKNMDEVSIMRSIRSKFV